MEGRTTPDGLLVGLARLAVAGDEGAMERLLAELHIDLLRYLRRWFRPWRQGEEIAAEIAQDSLVRVARGLHSFHGTRNGELVSWARAIAANLARDAARQTRDEWEAVVFGMELEEIETPDPDAGLGNGDGPAVSQGKRLMLRLLREALCSGNEEAQTLLWHRLVQGDSWSEAGAAVGLTHTAAKRRCQRFQDRLRATLLAQIDGLLPHEAEAVRHWLAQMDVLAPARLG
jgi:RNA polymerase sigma factor (sigma-70 family)